MATSDCLVELINNPCKNNIKNKDTTSACRITANENNEDRTQIIDELHMKPSALLA